MSRTSRAVAAHEYPPGYGGQWGPTPRNIPTGPGSRGGQWHDPEFRRAYFRAYRRAHPEHDEANRQRQRERRRQARLMRDAQQALGVVALSDILRLMVAEAHQAMSLRELARRMAIGYTSLTRFHNETRFALEGPQYDAMVAYFGLRAIQRRWAQQRRSAQGPTTSAIRSQGDPSGSVSAPAPSTAQAA